MSTGIARRVFSGKRLRQLRKDRGLGIEHLAVDIERSARTCLQYEAGNKQPSLDTAVAIATVLGCTVEDLFEEDTCSVVPRRTPTRPRTDAAGRPMEAEAR